MVTQRSTFTHLLTDRDGTVVQTTQEANEGEGLEQSGALNELMIADGGVTPEKVATGLIDVYVADGQDETSDTTIPVTGLVATDEVVGCIVFATKASITTLARRPRSDFTCTAGQVNVAAGAVNNTNNQYVFFVVHHA